MKFIGHILALMLATALSLTITLWALSATLGNAAYLERTAEQTHLYDNLSAIMPGTQPAQIRSLVNSSLPGLIDFVKGGPAPTIDFGSGPVRLGEPDPKVAGLMHNVNLAGMYAPLSVVVLVMLIIVVTGQRRLPLIAHSLLEAAVGVGISAAILWLAPGPALNLFSQPEMTALKSPLTLFITALFHGVASQLAMAALGLVVLTVLVRLSHGVLRLKNRFRREPKPSKNAPVMPPAGSGRGSF